MIPLRDSQPRFSFPGVTIALIVVNAAAFLYEQALGGGIDRFVFTFGLVPARLGQTGQHGLMGVPGAFLPFLTSMFLHAGWWHLIGNMWFLWIFGDNVEDRLGHARYLVFYLLCGVAGSLTHVFFNWGSTIPSLGASGAIAGVLGAYLVLFPGSRVLLFVPWFFFFTFELPAWMMLGYWFILQLGSGALEAVARTSEGVAWWAHVGGFVTGFVLVRWFAQRARQPYYHFEM